jgi:hypothetical protein
MARPTRLIALVALVMAGVVVVPGAAAATVVTSARQPSPDVGTSDSLSGVSCGSATACAAVGTYSTGSTLQTLVEMWDGANWSVASSPNVGAYDNQLDGVSCVSPTACIAVGTYSNGVARRTLVESWDGTSWSVVSSPNVGGGDNRLAAVSCVSASFCVAIGSSGNGGTPLIETWDGTTWSVAASASTGATDAVYGVSCVSASACTIVGATYYSFGGATFIESWDGSTWSLASSPNKGTHSNELDGVSCVSVTACTAVGRYSNKTNHFMIYSPFKTLIETWNGTTWAVVTSPNFGVEDRLAGVSCVSTSACAAVGSGRKSTGGYLTFAELFNGSTWAVKQGANGSTYDNFDVSVSCRTANKCTSVGDFLDGSGNGHTLIQVLAPPVAQVSPSTGGTGTPVALSGTGFRVGETVNFSYATRVSSPMTVLLCSGTADAYGTASCSGTIPVASAGPHGAHAITAKGAASHIAAKTSFTLT